MGTHDNEVHLVRAGKLIDLCVSFSFSYLNVDVEIVETLPSQDLSQRRFPYRLFPRKSQSNRETRGTLPTNNRRRHAL